MLTRLAYRRRKSERRIERLVYPWWQREDDGRPDRPELDSTDCSKRSSFGRKEDDGRPDRPELDSTDCSKRSSFGRKEDDGRPDRPDCDEGNEEG
jgi:hypothetical protein